MYPSSLYYIALQDVLGFASKSLVPVLLKYKNPEEIFRQSKQSLMQDGLLSKAQLDRVCDQCVERAEKTLCFCENSGITVIPYGDGRYPKSLLQIPDPPAVLYVMGDLPKSDGQPFITIVGSRKPTVYGALSAFNLSRALCSAGFVVVSGGALGIDSAAHEGALDVGGKTVAVLGTGFFANYLMRQEPLRRRICQNGALVTEFPPKMPARRYSFPMRNRIISALSLGTAVIQASERSGSLITASYASEQGRDVFALPGHAGEDCFAGSNNLIKNGAKPIFTFKDIAEEYDRLFVGKIDLAAGEQCRVKDGLPESLSESVNDGGFRAPKAPRPKSKKNLTFDGGNGLAKGYGTKDRAAGSDRSDGISEDPAESINKKFTEEQFQRDLSDDARVVYNSFKKNIALFDELSENSCLDSGRLLCALTELELEGLVSALSGNRYEKL